LLKTYTFYLRDGRDNERFEPAMCGSDLEAMSRARELLALHPDCKAIEVFFGDNCLFLVGRASA
jgi:hypothetical protein